MMKINGVLPDKADELLATFPEMGTTDPDIEDGLVTIYIPQESPVCINYNQVTNLLSISAWDFAKSVVLDQDEFVRFTIV